MNWNFTTLRDWLDRWVPSTPPSSSSPSVLSRLNHADELAIAGKPAEAVVIYADIIHRYPDEIAAYINCGSMCIDCGEYEAAVGVLHAGLTHAPTNTHLLANLSSALSALGQHDAALEVANASVLHGPSNAMAYYNRGECWAAVNQMIFSIRDLETATLLDPGNEEIARKLRLSRIAIAPPLDQYADAQYEPHAHGYEFVDGIEVRATLQCPHCGDHFPSIKGSRAVRGWCAGPDCRAITCGKAKCRTCTPLVRKRELQEKANRQLTTG